MNHALQKNYFNILKLFSIYFLLWNFNGLKFLDFDGLILSPTRDKLEPTIPRKDSDSRSSQKSSPKKSSPLKSSSLKRNYQKSAKTAPRNGESFISLAAIGTIKRIIFVFSSSIAISWSYWHSSWKEISQTAIKISHSKRKEVT